MLNDSKTLDFLKTFAQLDAAGTVQPCPVTRAFWEGSVKTDPHARFVGCVRFRSNRDLHSDIWEKHPTSDELILLISGELDVVLEAKAGDASSDVVKRLQRLRAFIVPAGVWHRLIPVTPGELLFINTRRDTAHRSGR
jgi:mannose-6-phosphate isomerase-like protein (cupin superfamily)